MPSGSTVSPRPSPHDSATSDDVASVVDRGGLDRRTGGDQLVLGRDPDRTSGEVSHDAPVGGTAGGTADEEHGSMGRFGAERIGPGEQIAHHALDGGPGELGRCHVGAQARQDARGIRPVRRPLAVEMGDEHEPTRAGGRLERQRVEPRLVHPEQTGDSVGHLGRVHSADERQIAATRVRKTGDRSGGVSCRFGGDSERGATRSEAQRQVARPEPEGERSRHVVAGPCGHRDPNATPFPGDGVGRQHLWERRLPIDVVADETQEVAPVAGFPRRPVARTRGVSPIGGPSAREPEGEPVVRQHDGRDAPEGLGLAAVEPMQLGDREARERDASARGGPTCLTTWQRGEEHAGVGCGFGVVPELGRAQDIAVIAEDDEAVLLRGH